MNNKYSKPILSPPKVGKSEKISVPDGIGETTIGKSWKDSPDRDKAWLKTQRRDSQ